MSSAHCGGRLVVADVGTGRHRELRPSVGVRKSGSIDVGVGLVRGVERDYTSPVGIINVPQVVQPEAMNEVTGVKA